jgi:septation ring formation regulator EzrA
MNHESGENINLGLDIIEREAKARQSIKQKDSFVKSPLSMV